MSTTIKRGANQRLTGLVDGVPRAIDNFPAAGDLIDLCATDFKARGTTRGFSSIGNKSRGGRFANGHVTIPKSQDANNFATGFAYSGQASDFEHTDIVVVDAGQLASAQKYANGDGFSTELGNRLMLFRRCTAINPTDRGHDHKGSGIALDDCIVVGGRYGYAAWTGNEWKRIASYNALAAALQVTPAVEHKTQQTVVVEHLTARNAPHAIRVETKGGIPPRIIIKSSDIAGITGKLVDVIGPAPEVIWG